MAAEKVDQAAKKQAATDEKADAKAKKKDVADTTTADKKAEMQASAERKAAEKRAKKVADYWGGTVITITPGYAPAGELITRWALAGPMRF